MRIALVLVVALVCVAVVAAGSGKKHKTAKHNGERNKREASQKSRKEPENRSRDGGQEAPRKSRDTKDAVERSGAEPEKSKSDKPKRDKIKPEKSKPEKTGSDERVDTGKQKIKEQKHKYRKAEKAKSEENAKSEESEACEGEQDEVVAEVESQDGECSRDSCADDAPQVTLDSGAQVRGTKGKTRKGRDTAEYKGVPYAEPPQADRRFQEAVLKEWWPGVLRADRPGNDCLQYSHFSYSVSGSEDCLYLNIYTPQVDKASKRPDELLPVVVYIHGGAFMFYSSAEGGPKYLLDKDLVLVTLNYRLGPLGFFTLGDDSVAGNLGLRDQMTALRWVQRNIKSFGGDPSRVTIAGMSAGGASVHYHILSPLSKGLFSKAISISGMSLNPWAEAENLVEKSRAVAVSLGCDAEDSHSVLACLRSRPAERIVATAKDMQVWLYNPISPWAPSPEPKTAANPFLADSPIDLMRRGRASDVPWLVSWTSQEGGYPAAEFVFEPSLTEYLEKNWSGVLPHLLEFNLTAPSERHDDISASIKEFYLKGKSADDPGSLQDIVDMVSDRLFLEGIGQGIQSHVDNYQSALYAYRFSHVSNDSVASYICRCPRKLDGACHADDVGYLLEVQNPVLATPQDLDISNNMVDMWYSFITTGQPVFGDQALPRVTREDGEGIPFLDVEQGGSSRLTRTQDLGNRAFWRRLGLSADPSPPHRDEL